LASRARRQVSAQRPRFEVSTAEHTRIVEQFMDTMDSGNINGLLAVLDKEVTWSSDGGGLPGIAKKPIHGAENVARFVVNLRRVAPATMDTRLVEINGRPGFITYIDGKAFNTLSFDIVEGRIVKIWAVVNPDKLRMINI
jgi:RNA polymerase sigma-70 factor (ECF subfamily)